jgi:hypothetical protein
MRIVYLQYFKDARNNKMKRMTGMILMGVGLIAFLSGAFVYGKAGKNEMMLNHEEQLNQMVETAAEDGVLTQREREKIQRRAEELGLDHEKHLERAEQLARDHTEEDETQVIDHIKKAGDDFEGYVVKNFDKEYFKLKNWAGDKYIDGIYAETTLHPDLLLQFNYRDHSELFSVECKWRSGFKNSKVQVANAGQIERYQIYASENNQPVFLALGIAGKASKPVYLYMVPINDLTSNTVTQGWLKKYKLPVMENFFYEYKKNQFRY